MHYIQPKKNANVTITSADGARIQTRFHHAVNGRWTLAFNVTKAQLMTSFDVVEINFIFDEHIYTAKANVSGVNSSIGSCFIDSIQEYQSRPLRGEDRIAVSLPCSIITKDKITSRSTFIDNRQNIISNLSYTGALLSTNMLSGNGNSLLMLFALDIHAELDPALHRMYIRGHIVREQENSKSPFAHHYGIQFGNTNPSFQHLLKTYLENMKLNAAGKTTRAA